MQKLYAVIIFLLLQCDLTAHAQRFFNLTSEQVSVDSVMPSFSYSVPLPDNYADSTYSMSILYPEFIDMSDADIANYHRMSQCPLPALPTAESNIIFDRKRPSLLVSFCPLVYRDGKYQILVSFMLRIDAKANKQSAKSHAKSSIVSAAPAMASVTATTTTAADRYAAHSVLAEGSWAKIRVPATGVYELTAALARQAGFSDISKVRVYGYGGNLQKEILDGNDLITYDDLKEVPTCNVNGHRLFYAKGPVSWSSKEATRRTRNPYSDYGYYFITSGDATPASLDSTAFLDSFYPATDDYHSLYEVDGYSWFPGGRNLFDSEALPLGQTKTLILSHPKGATSGRLSVNISAGSASTALVTVNGNTMGSLSITLGDYDKGNERMGVYDLSNLSEVDTVKVTVTAGGPMRLDFVSVAWDAPAPKPTLTATFPTPQYVCNITNQDHHADAQADMVIIIPTSQKLLAQARRLAAFHEQHDSLRVNIVPADELYNEFSSGTPDANAYRRYMKMLYDRAQSDADMPRYLLLFGAGVWDNRMLTSDCRNLDADDYLLCYESENSFNQVECYVDDGFFTYLDDGEGVNLTNVSKRDLSDVAVGRFPVSTVDQAKIMVDKVINYATNDNAGAWQNTIMFMGDDGNDNLHMEHADEAAETIAALYPDYQIKKVMWDAYKEEVTSVGNRYPEVSEIIKQQQQQGALIMDYVGHGRADWMSHEAVLTVNDFKSFTNKNLPLWITASCDIMPFDGIEENFGVTAVANNESGAVAFFGTTRTVYATYNRVINMAYLRYVLSQKNGKPITIGEAQRLAKNEIINNGADLTTNKLQYSLLGDPALALQQPTAKIVIDSINGLLTSASSHIVAKAGSKARIAGHIVNGDSFNGTITLQALDSKLLVTCRKNPGADVENDAFTFYNRDKTVYSGTNYVRNGKFDISFTVPYDINYNGSTGLITTFAVNDDKTLTAHGSNENIILGSTDITKTDSLGPKIFCYLNTPDFTDGGTVNTEPYFVAQLSDSSGINATGNGIGHDMELVIDGSSATTYSLNDNFQYDFGSSTTGYTYYNIPALEPGKHSLRFRAWDTMNNVSTATLNFNVVKSLEPTISSVAVSKNPASTSTTFIITHNFGGCNVEVTIDVFDMSGRQLWTYSETGAQTGNAYTVDWDLTQSNGQKLQTGVYLYRVRLSADGSSKASKAQKLIVVNNN